MAEQRSEPRIARRVVVRGRVQGVGFRDFVLERAEKAGLSGWVRNRKDGSLEFKAEGPQAAVLALIDACRTGPAGAEIRTLEANPSTLEGSRGFGRWPTV